MTVNFLDGLSGGGYAGVEGEPSADSARAIAVFQTQTSSMSVSEKAAITALLEQAETYISSNRSTVQKQVEQLTESQNIINQELNNYKNDDTAKQLGEKPIPPTVLDAANVAYAEYYSDMVELKYRLAVIAYRKAFLQEQLTGYDNQMKIIQLYLQAL